MDRKMSRRELLKWAGITAGATALGGCAPMVGQPTSAPAAATGEPAATAAAVATPASAEKVLNVYLYQKPALLMPAKTSHGQDAQILTLVHDRVVKLDDRFVVQPDLAESWDITDGGKVFTFKFRQGVKFHDGVELTAEDAAYTIRMALDPAINSEWGPGYLSRIKGYAPFREGEDDEVEGIRVLDPYTLQIELSDPDVSFLTTLARSYCGVMPKHIWQEIAPEEADRSNAASNPVGSGPFKFVSNVVDQYVELEANTEYWGGRPQFDRVFMKPMTTETALAQLLSGELDLASIAVADIPTVESTPGLKVVSVPGVGIVQYRFNFDTIPDARVRQAFSYAIDKQGIVDTVLQGQGTVPQGFLTFGPEWKSPTLEPYPYDPDKARELLAEAGWDTNKTLRLRSYKSVQHRQQAAEIIIQQAAEVGLKLDFQLLDPAAWNATYQSAEWDIHYVGGGNYAIDPGANINYFICKPNDPMAPYTWCSEEFDKLAAQGASETDPEKRKEIYWQMEQMIHDDVAMLPVYSDNYIYGMKEDLVGTKLHGDITAPYWNMKDWHRE